MFYLDPASLSAASPAAIEDQLRGVSVAARGNHIEGRSSLGRPAVMRAQWDIYRRGLSAQGGPLEPAHGVFINSLWDSLKKMIPSISEPEAAPSADGQVFGMAWDSASQHFEIEVFASGIYEWFYKNFLSGVRDGEENVYVGSYSPQMAARLVETLRAKEPIDGAREGRSLSIGGYKE